jgi:4-hydroxyphenylpyruvate dioxygenase
MSSAPALGIRRIEAIHYYVRDLERSRRFYTEKLDFTEVARSSEELSRRGRQDALVFEAGACRVICSSPRGEGGRAHRYLQKHPDGVGSIVFEVEDIGRVFRLLEERGGTPVHDVRTTEVAAGRFRTFIITTPFGDTTFRFVEREGTCPLYPGFDVQEAPRGGKNVFAFTEIDHVTSNFETMAPALLWMEHVLGFQRFWEIAFHTDDVGRRLDEHGSGLRSVVMWDEPQLHDVADQRLPRGAPGRRRPARGASRPRHRLGRPWHARARRGVHAHACGLL